VGKNEYLLEVGERLDGDIDVFWTGRDIVSEAITVAEIRELAAVIRRPPVLWDNLYANDYDLRRMNLGPYAGRELGLKREVRGILINPNCEYRANFAPFRTFAAYANARGSWNARAAHRRALAEWLPIFVDEAGALPGLDELEFLTDCLHLPYGGGPGGEAFLQVSDAMLRSTGSGRVALRRRFDRAAGSLVRWQSRITELADRDLSYTLYRFVWELKEEVDLLQRFLKWQEQPKRSRGPFRSLFHQPGTYRGGLVARLQRLLVARPDGSFELPAD
jgi:protein O-GlcNAcase/histone acetyltransferase